MLCSRSRPRATASTRHPGPPVEGYRGRGRRVDQGDQPARRSRPPPRACRSWPRGGAAALRLRQRGTRRHRQDRVRQSRPRSIIGNRRLIRASRIACPAPCHRVNATSSVNTMPNTVSTPLTASTTTTVPVPAAITRPAQPATSVPRSRSWVTAHTPARNARPPSSGRPGQHVEDRHDHVADRQLEGELVGEGPVGQREGHGGRRDPPSTSETAGPASDTSSVDLRGWARRGPSRCNRRAAPG